MLPGSWQSTYLYQEVGEKEDKSLRKESITIIHKNYQIITRIIGYDIFIMHSSTVGQHD